MIKIDIICVGNLKEKFYRDAEAEFLKRLSKFCEVNIIELKEENKYDTISRIKEEEGKKIITKLSGYIIGMDIKGKELSSEDFSKKIEKLSLEKGKLTFLIGGSYGLSEEVKSKCHEFISFSKMTFTHNMFRILLLEQIYRGFCIINNTGYHK